MAVLQKNALSLEDIESQIALELPERETLDFIVAKCLAVCVGQIRIDVGDVQLSVLQVALNVCNTTVNAAVLGIAGITDPVTAVECSIQQTGPRQN